MDVIVVFDMWGQRCETKFDSTSELDSMAWIKNCVDKGFMYPIEVVRENGEVLYTEEQLQEMISELCLKLYIRLEGIE